MKNSLCSGMVFAALLGLGVVRGQTPTPVAASHPGTNPFAVAASAPNLANQPGAPGADLYPSSNGGPNGAATAGGGPEPYAPGLGDYLSYLRPTGCCGPVGGDGPIGGELFMRAGISFPIGGSIFGQILDPGPMIQGGARALFFTPKQDLAWTVEIGITSVWYDAGVDNVYHLRNLSRVQRAGPGGEFIDGQFFQAGQVITDRNGDPLQEIIPRLPIVPSSLNQTYVHLSIGHEFYLHGFADCSDGGWKCRAGYDMGGRWGSSKLIVVKRPFEGDGGSPNRDLFNHLNDVVGGLFLALHSEIEMPINCCILFAGVRTEAAYIWSDIMQPQNNTDLMMLNLMFNFGCRY